MSWRAVAELRTNTERSDEQIGHTSFLAVAGIGLGALSLVIILTSGSPELICSDVNDTEQNALSAIVTAPADAIAGTHRGAGNR